MWSDLHGEVEGEFRVAQEAVEAQYEGYIFDRLSRQHLERLALERRRSAKKVARILAKRAADRAPLPKPHAGRPRKMAVQPLANTKQLLCHAIKQRHAQRAAKREG